MNNIASPWQRLLARSIDVAFLWLFPIFLISIFSTSTDTVSMLNRLSLYVVLLIMVYPIVYIFLSSFLVSRFGGTVGKLATGIKVVLADGQLLSFWKAFFRDRIAYIVSGVLLWLGFIWILVDKERRTWHDQIVDSYVVTGNKKLAFLGVVVLAAIIFLEFNLVSSAVSNFIKNGVVYKDVYDALISAFKTP
ncbi:MAG: Membrane protein [Microgenomates group bacterium GW2011_GWC1_39_7b]|uniref:Membrane protein n=3 Tax=Candidatus Woeseibacteriota TaxID=1752722 RepID=A0A0G0PRZ0_9BACT|nr:MAG: Membrane protein [Candidatus Woesebacteria bacterium GW2011_GWB1_39_10]KKR26849.1 MAG: Membrane protein [Microgenomates group bacterium GW2011_GWC1_39_7b]KKR73188.1 MAG: Membrane protein [Candidatus Woesebacteria bacterium GW2011_GWA2_40_7]KKS91061.1 MAG: Membrane protein [Candidatus Woesebacteria bacterium GW2011_GWA1_43_12]